MTKDKPVDRHAAVRFLAERYGPSAGSVAELGGGDWSRAFSFRLDHRDFVARFGRHLEDFTKDQKAMAFARPELPVPAVLEVGERHGLRSEEHTSELQSPMYLVCRLLLEKKKTRCDV